MANNDGFIENEEYFDIFYQYVRLKDDIEVFTQAGIVEDEDGKKSLMMKHPLRIFREYTDSTFSLFFEELCPFTDDVFIEIQEKDVVFSSILQDKHIKYYTDALKKLNKFNNEEHEYDEFDDIDEEDNSDDSPSDDRILH